VFAGLLLDGARFSGPKKTGSLRGDQRLTSSVSPPPRRSLSHTIASRPKSAPEADLRDTFDGCVPNAIGVVQPATLLAINDWSQAAELLFEKEVR
jgi:hypothetical protein